MSNPVVWFEVMGQDTDKLRRFYSELLAIRARRGRHGPGGSPGRPLCGSGEGVERRAGSADAPGRLGSPRAARAQAASSRKEW